MTFAPPFKAVEPSKTGARAFASSRNTVPAATAIERGRCAFAAAPSASSDLSADSISNSIADSTIVAPHLANQIRPLPTSQVMAYMLDIECLPAIQHAHSIRYRGP